MLDKLFRKNGKSNDTEPILVSSSEKQSINEEDLAELARIHTDSEFLQAHYRLIDRHDRRKDQPNVSHVPILESSFIEKSAGAYPAPWAGRELIQNWLDAESVSEESKKEKGSLDGVTFQEESLSDGYTKFIISGDWALTNLDGLVGLSSDKPTGPTAGGNGIGLKQTALRFLRDSEFGVRTFDIYATSNQTDTPVQISYDLVSPEDVESQYAKRNTSPIRNIQKPWLMGTITDVDRHDVTSALSAHKKSRDACAYVIETDNPQTIKLLQNVKDFGVSSENPYLQDPDFESQKGSIGWSKDRNTEGKLFINGQMMDYEDKTTDDSPYPGPKGVTIRLNNLDYPMSIDRPPVRFTDLRNYARGLFENESQEALIDQLKASQHLWSLSSDDKDIAESNFNDSLSSGYSVAIQSLIESVLPQAHVPGDKKSKEEPYTYDNFKSDFGDNYVYADKYGLELKDVQEAEEMGYRVCLNDLSKLGVPSIKDVIDSSDRLAQQRPAEWSYDLANESKFRLADRVFHEKFEANNMDTMRDEFIKQLPDIPRHVDIDGGRIKITFDISAGESLLMDDLAERDPDSSAEEIIYSCRGLIAGGLNMKSIDSESSYMLIDGRVMTFGLVEKSESKSDFLLVAQIPESKTINQSNRDKIVVQFDLVDVELADKWKEGESATVNTVATGAEEVAAIKNKQPDSLELSDADKIEETRRALREGVSLVPTSNPEDTDLVDIISDIEYVPVSLSEEAKKRFEKVKKTIPELDVLVEKLEEAAASDTPTPLSGREKLMLQWLHTQNSSELSLALESATGIAGETQISTSYLDPETLVLSLAHILELNEQAEIPVSIPMPADSETGKVVTEASKLKSLGEKVGKIASKFIPDAENLENFELITSPSPEQKKKLTLLKSVMVAVGYEANNDLFIFKGNNVKGFNIDQKAIGLHEGVLGTGFQEAFSVFRHEIAHNRVMDHSAEFIATDEAIAAHMITAMSTAAKKLLDTQISLMKQGKNPDEIESEITSSYTREFLIVNAQDMWEEMV